VTLAMAVAAHTRLATRLAQVVPFLLQSESFMKLLLIVACLNDAPKNSR